MTISQIVLALEAKPFEQVSDSVNPQCENSLPVITASSPIYPTFSGKFIAQALSQGIGHWLRSGLYWLGCWYKMAELIDVVPYSAIAQLAGMRCCFFHPCRSSLAAKML